MGLPAWLWFVIAAVCALAGGFLLLRGRLPKRSAEHERQRWANLRGWQYVEEDPQLVEKWTGGAIAYFGAQYTVDVVAGSTFTSDGRRPVYIFDLETEGVVDVAVAAVRCNREAAALVELWLPTVPFQRDQMPDLLGPVGQRYAFVSDVNTARAMITRDLVDAVDEIGDDVTVVWLEADWVLAAITPDANPARLERLLRDLGEVADLVDPFENQQQETGRHTGYHQPGPYSAPQAGPPTGPPPLPQPDPPAEQREQPGDDEPDPRPAQSATTSWSARSRERWTDSPAPEPAEPTRLDSHRWSADRTSSATTGRADTGHRTTSRATEDTKDTDEADDPEPARPADLATFPARPAPWQSAWRSTGRPADTDDEPPEREPTSQAVHPARATQDRATQDRATQDRGHDRTGLVRADLEDAGEYDDYDEEIAEIDPTGAAPDDVPAPRPGPAGDTDEATETDEAGGTGEAAHGVRRG